MTEPTEDAERAAENAHDADLLRRHVDGDPEAFEELVQRHSDRLWAVALRTMRDPEEAADALQDAFVNAFRRAGQFRGDSLVTSWLHRIVVNACLDRRRRGTSRPSDATDFESGEPPAGTRTDHPLSGTAPDHSVQVSLHLDLRRALDTLPDDQRIPLLLVDLEGYSVSEVAELLGLPTGTVKSRCARARTRLVPLLQGNGSSGDSEASGESRSSGTTGRNRSADGNVSSTDPHDHGGDQS